MIPTKSHPVPPFYDVSDNPPPMPLLSHQVEMVYQITSPVTVSANEEMLTAGEYTAIGLQRTTTTPPPSRPFKLARFVAPVPTASPPPSRPFKLAKAATPIPADSESSAPHQRSEHSPAPTESSLSSLESEDDIEIGKIPKPSGEAGRPGRGGYNLEERLAWGEDGFKNLNKFVNRAVKRHLDVTKCRSLQDRKALECVREKTLAQFPDLIDFENCWPVFDLIQLRLKYTSSRSRKASPKEKGKNQAK